MEPNEDEPSTLNQIKAIWSDWKYSTHQMRSSHAMIQINKLLKEDVKP